MEILVEEKTTIIDATIHVSRPVEKSIPDDLWKALSEEHWLWDRIGQTFYFYDISQYRLDNVAKLLLAFEEEFEEQREKEFENYLEKFLTGEVD